MHSLKQHRILLILLGAVFMLIASPAYAIHQAHVQVKITSSLGSSITVTCGPPLPGLNQSANCAVSPASGGSVTYDSSPLANVTKNADGSVITVNFPPNILLDNTFRVRGLGSTDPQGECAVLKNASTTSTTATVNQVRVRSTKAINESQTASSGEAGVTIECIATIGLPDANSVNVTGNAHVVSSTGSFYRKVVATNSNAVAGGDDHTANGSFFYFLSGGNCPGLNDPDPSGGFPSGCVAGRNLPAGSPGTASNSYAVPTQGVNLLLNTIANGINIQLVDHDINGNTIAAKCVDFFGANKTCLAAERLGTSLFYNLANPSRNSSGTVLTVDRAEITGTGITASGPPPDLAALLAANNIPGLTWLGGAVQPGAKGNSSIDAVEDPSSGFDPFTIVCNFTTNNVPQLVLGDSAVAAPAYQCIEGINASGLKFMRMKFTNELVTAAAGGVIELCDQFPGMTGTLVATATFNVEGTVVKACTNKPQGGTCTESFEDSVETLGAGQLVVPINPCK